MRLSNVRCVVTGGASGIGAATVRRFVQEGAEVCILDYDLPAAEALARSWGSRSLRLNLMCVLSLRCRPRPRQCMPDGST